MIQIKDIKSENGITLTALVITIIVLMIIGAISIREGGKIIKDANIQTLETNMLSIKAKAKIYAEEIDALVWTQTNPDKASLYTQNYGMEVSNITFSNIILEQLNDEIDTNNYDAYKITKTTLEKMGLNELEEDLEDGDYIVIYDAEDYNIMDIVYTSGVSYENEVFYTLTSLQLVYVEE